MKYITIKDIARHLSISVSTVSRALGDDKNIRKETKEKVIEAAKRLGYRPNPVAINLKYGHTNTVGVIVPEMVTPFASRVINGIQEVLHTKNIKVIIAESGGDPEKEKENLQLMEGFMVDGIIICLCSYKRNKEEYSRLQQAGMPMVFYDRIPYGLEVPQVIVDDYMKSFFLVESLIRSGRKQIVHIQGPDDIYNSIERVRGYKDALAKFGIPFDKNNMLIKTGMTFEEGKKAADILVERNIPFNAIFAFTETLAIGAMNRLRELGKKNTRRNRRSQLFRNRTFQHSLSQIDYSRTAFVPDGEKSCRTYFRENQRSGISQSFNRVGCGNKNACIDATFGGILMTCLSDIIS